MAMASNEAAALGFAGVGSRERKCLGRGPVAGPDRAGWWDWIGRSSRNSTRCVSARREVLEPRSVWGEAGALEALVLAGKCGWDSLQAYSFYPWLHLQVTWPGKLFKNACDGAPPQTTEGEPIVFFRSAPDDFQGLCGLTR